MRLVWYRKQKKRRKLKKCVILLLIIAALIFGYRRSVAPVTIILEAQAQQLITEMEHRIVSQVLSEQGSALSELSVVQRQNDGTISGVEVNTTVVNELRNEILLRMNEELITYAKDGYRIPMGTLFGGVWLAERGPMISFRISSANQSDSYVMSTLSSAGYNQTLHTITLSIRITAYAVMPGYRQPVDTTNEFLLAETVIVGTVPDYVNRTVG